MERTRGSSTGPSGRLDGLSVSRRSSLSVPATLTRSPRTGETTPNPTNSVYTPPSDPRDPTAPTPNAFRYLLTGVLFVVAVPLGLFVASEPFVVGLAALVGLLYTGSRRAVAAVRRLGDRPLRLDLPGDVRLQVVRHPVDSAREERPVEAR